MFIDDSEDFSDKIITLLRNSLSETASKMTLKFDQELVKTIVPNPEFLPIYFKNEPVNFYISFKKALTNPTNF